MAPRQAVSMLLDILESSFSEMAPSKIAPLIRAGFSPQQARILCILADANGVVVSYGQILIRLENMGNSPSENSVRQQVYHIRRKLKEIESLARLEVVWGEGLILVGGLPSSEQDTNLD